MAETAVTPHHGEMPIQAQAATYKDVMELFKWGSLGVGDLLILLVLWFCTPAGLFPALVVAGIVFGLGAFWLSRKPAAH